MAQTTSRKYLLYRLILGVVVAGFVFMLEAAPEKAMAEKDVVYTVSELIELAHAPS